MNFSTNGGHFPHWKTTIQDTVLTSAKLATNPQSFHIEEIRFIAYVKHGSCLSYKQVRDAIYRTRQSAGLQHNGLGFYSWVS